MPLIAVYWCQKRFRATHPHVAQVCLADGSKMGKPDKVQMGHVVSQVGHVVQLSAMAEEQEEQSLVGSVSLSRRSIAAVSTHSFTCSICVF